MGSNWYVVVYHKGKRIVRDVPDAKTGLELNTKCKEKGLASHLISKRKAFAPKQDEGPAGTLWCPYCRKWREFRIPRGNEDAEPGSWPWWLSALSRMEVMICPWCGITERDWYVKRFNGLFGQEEVRRRSKKKGRRHRIGAR